MAILGIIGILTACVGVLILVDRLKASAVDGAELQLTPILYILAIAAVLCFISFYSLHSTA